MGFVSGNKKNSVAFQAFLTDTTSSIDEKPSNLDHEFRHDSFSGPTNLARNQFHKIIAKLKNILQDPPPNED